VTAGAPVPMTRRSVLAHERIVDAAARRFARAAPSDVSLGDIAAEAGVSKALILYHFKDRDSLIASVVDRVAERLAARERAALLEHETPLTLDLLWHWLEVELHGGDLRALLSLAHLQTAPVRAATERASARRRSSAAEAITRLFETLGLRPRVPPALIGDVCVAFVDGLALDTSRPPVAQRLAFDVFWLAMLSLTE
jgi:AcrR family transcriptional regulator